MKILSLLAATLSAGTLLAQAPAYELDARVQVFGEFSQATSITIANSPIQVTDRPGSMSGFGVRFMGEVASAPGWYYEAGGRLDASSNFTFNGPIGNGFTLDVTNLKFTSSYWSLGAAYLFRPSDTFSLGLHLEGRGEALTAQGELFQNGVSMGKTYASTTYLRPWVRASVDVTLPMGKMRPYLGVDGAVAITRTSQTNYVSINVMDARTLKAMAPNVTLGVYAGMRF